ncbi:DMT family transporter [Methylobacter sp.]|uniref:DMT family transporter n=1 Tax=Methylobacter sp. TaxID=2051955 RepID=UPI003DA31DFD
MRIPLAYISIILIWATTPLAIKWSGEGPGFLFGVAGRMSIGAACVVTLLLLMRQRLAWHRKARQTYLAVALQIYGSMLAVYWAAQFIPSGWISVIFGLSPLITALLSAIWLRERSLTPGKLLSYGFGIGGLAVMFGSALQFGPEAVLGIAGVLVSAFLQSASAVWVQRIQAKLPALSQVAGGLLLAVPAYWLTWWLIDGQWPESLPPASLASIVYLGVIATTIGFVLYYYVLTHLAATRVALITLLSPVLALMLGHTVNHEPLTMKIATGTALILAALVMHEYFDRVTGYLIRKTTAKCLRSSE